MIIGFYALACLFILTASIWACWFTGDDLDLDDLMKLVLLSFIPLLNFIMVAIMITEAIRMFLGDIIGPYKNRVLIRGRKR